jgi:hypothetical protein
MKLVTWIQTLSLIFFTLSARADFIGQVYLFGQEMRYEREQDQTLKDRQPKSWGLGFWWNTWGFEYEASSFEVKTQEGNLAVERDYTDQKLWLKKSVYRYQVSQSLMDIYIGGAFGQYAEEIKTTFAGSTSLNSTKPKTLLAASLGAQFFQFFWQHWGLAVGAEGQLFFAQNFDPSPMPGINLRLGFTF